MMVFFFLQLFLLTLQEKMSSHKQRQTRSASSHSVSSDVDVRRCACCALGLKVLTPPREW